MPSLLTTNLDCGIRQQFHGLLPFSAASPSQVPSYSFAIVVKFLAVTAFQELFFTQYLAVEQPYARDNVGQENPIGKHQELAQQDEGKCQINGIAAESKNSSRYKFVRVLGIDTDAKTLSERN